METDDHHTPTETGEAVLVDVRQVARMLDVSERQVWRLAATQKMPVPLSIGRLKRWKRCEVLRWINAGCPAGL